MAVKLQELGGYDLNFLSDPPDALKCLICYSVAREPWQHVTCGRLFCYTCLQRYLKENSKCPACRVEEKTQYFQDRKSSREVDMLKVRCGQGDHCSWEGELGNYRTHSTTCPSRVVLCPKKCLTAEGKLFQCIFKNLDQHLDNDCPYRTAECSHCNQEGSYQDIHKEHLENCPFMLEACPSEGCEVEISSVLLLFHLLTDCEYAPTPCKYINLGCTTVLTPRNLKDHEQDHSTHFEMLTEAVSNLQMQLHKAQKQISSLQDTLMQESNSRSDQSLHSVTFKLPHLSSYAKNDSFTFNELFSDANMQGYQFSIKILPYNDGYLSIYFFLKKGPNDENLHWPFRGSIQVELLNQVRDGSHHHETVEIHRSHGQRVVDGDTSARGFGLPQFIELDKLRQTSGRGHTKTQYLVDDCLYFRTTIKPRQQKHWLKCTH